jgi:hypothetical protein
VPKPGVPSGGCPYGCGVGNGTCLCPHCHTAICTSCGVGLGGAGNTCKCGKGWYPSIVLTSLFFFELLFVMILKEVLVALGVMEGMETLEEKENLVLMRGLVWLKRWEQWLFTVSMTRHS